MRSAKFIFEDEYRAPEGTPIDEIKKIQATIKEERAEGGLGFDLPDAVCPHCGEKLHKDGLKFLLKHSLDLVVQRNRISTLTSPVNTGKCTCVYRSYVW